MAKKALVLVEGDLQRQEGLGGSLVGEGYMVETLVDSGQAMKKMRENKYDVAVIDLDLPPLHGVAVTPWDLGRIFRAYNPGISIVYVSGGLPEESKTVRSPEVVMEGALAP